MLPLPGALRELRKFGKLAADYLEEGVDLSRNLAEMEAAGLEAWLERAAEEYTCRSCGGPLTVGRTLCHHCGATRRKD